jgi:DNA-directed RNA polymerase subunit K/omega
VKSVDDLTQEVRIGPPKLTRFERARIIGARSLQLSLGAPILSELPEKMSDPIKEDLLPMTLRRILPDRSWQDIDLHVLLQWKSSRFFT